MRWSQFSTETRGTIIFAAVIWTIVAVAAMSMALGNPTAINAVVGCSIPGAFAIWWAVSLARQDRRMRR